MTEKFIKNEQLNFIKRQVIFIKDSRKKSLPPTVLAAAIDLANAKIMGHFPNASMEQCELLDLSKMKTDDEYDQYIDHLSNFVIPFPKITEQQLKKIFPKHKKLKLPEISDEDYNHLTYLSWNDKNYNKKFVIYELEGKMVGIECKYSPTSKKNVCSICNSVSKVVYFSTVTKNKKSNNSDYYRSIGNLICADSNECNHNITEADYLVTFLKDALVI